VIARVWTAHTTPARAPRYAEHLRTRVLPQLRSLTGYAGAWLFRRDANGETELVVVTRWQSEDSVRAFAGQDVEAAVVEDAAAALLSRFDTRVRHYEIVAEDTHDA
jgi:heme-degrading monooxygenase HmoA